MERFNYSQESSPVRNTGDDLHTRANATYGRVPFNETDELFSNPNVQLAIGRRDDKAEFKAIYEKQQRIKRERYMRQQQQARETFENTLLFESKFINPNVYDPRDDQRAVEKQDAFRRFYEDKIETSKIAKVQGDSIFDIARQDLDQEALDLQETLDPQDLLLTNAVSDIKNLEAENVRAINQQTSEEQRFFKNQRTMVNIDSRDRDKTIYPFPNRYKVDLGRPFYNVKKILLRSSEFPNTEQLIRDTPVNKANNKIFWRNEGSNDVFVAAIAPGNYRPSSLQSTIQAAMNKIRRDEDNFHEFTVTIDTVADTCTFSSLSSRQVAQPFFTTEGTSIITVKVVGHGFADGQLITISGASGFAGVNLARVNTNHVITYVDADEFTFDIGDNIVQTAGNEIDGGVGGNQVRMGTGLPFELLWSLPGTPATILGFERVDTGFSTLHSNTIINRTYSVEEVKNIDTVYTSVLIDSSSITTNNPYDLLPADLVFISGVTGTSTDELINIPSGYQISSLTTTDLTTLGYTTAQDERAFKIPAVISSATVGTGGTVSIRTLNRPVALAGENYMFMIVLPQQNHVIGDMSNSGPVIDIFSKVDLSAPPGNILFNTFISNGKTFYETPLREIRTMDFEYRDQNNDLFDFIDADHSFTLEIVEQVHRVAGDSVAYNSRIGQSDET